MERFAREGALTYSNFEGSWFLISPRCGTDDQWFPDVIVIVLGFQVAAVNVSEEPPSLDQRTVGGRENWCRTDWQGRVYAHTGSAGSRSGHFNSGMFP